MTDPVPSPAPGRARSGSSRGLLLLVVVLLGAALAIGWWLRERSQSPEAQATQANMRAASARRTVPAVIDTVRAETVPVVISAVGTVTPRASVVARPRVDGLLQSLGFKEGDRVKAGDTIAQIDPKPFEALVQAAQGQLDRDRAQLEIARLDLTRYSTLLEQDSIARQQVDAQRALVKQLEGTVAADAAQLASARLNLGYTRVTAPIGGRAGLRQIDPGNIVHGTDPSGLVLITEVQPITAVFAIPQERLPAVLDRVSLRGRADAGRSGGDPVRVQALDRDGRTVLDTGHLLALDNQIDPGTGTVKLKAIFPNAAERLFPNQFVNIQLLLERLEGALTLPSSAVQRGASGSFVYRVTAEQTAQAQPVKLGSSAPGDRVVILDGLAEGDRVVIDGADKLRDGAPVTAIDKPVRGAAPRTSGGGSADRR